MTNTSSWGVAGLTDAPRAPIVANAKIGRRNDDGSPQRLDHIIFVEYKTGQPLKEYQRIFGDEPKYFDALLPADTIEAFTDCGRKRWGAKGLKCRGDGITAVDMETGEQRPCAGPWAGRQYERYACEHARPTPRLARGGEQMKDRTTGELLWNAPACGPRLTMQLIVPQVPGLGLVQISTGGAESSIPNLVAQLRIIESRAGGRMAGVAVRVKMHAFPDAFGNTAWGWLLEPLDADTAALLRQSIVPLERIGSQIAVDLPPIDEGEQDIDLEPGSLREIPAATGVDPVKAAECAYEDALRESSTLTEAKKLEYLALMRTNREQADKNGTAENYVAWLQAQTARVPA